MSSERDQQLMEARELDKMSTAMVRFGINVVKKNPIKVSAYILGILLCLFFTGWKVTETQFESFQQKLDTLDNESLNKAAYDLERSYNNYYRSKGWFSCDPICQENKLVFEESEKLYNSLKQAEDAKLSEAKSVMGLFSEYGVEETRNMFWGKFAQGKGFAQRQTKFDALFLGISAMGRDESIVSYILRVVLNMLFNFTIGVIGAVVAFIFSLIHLVRTYQAPFLVGVAFFALASISAAAFALTWILGLYVATAGTVYVGAKLISSNLRIEGGRQRHRVQ